MKNKVYYFPSRIAVVAVITTSLVFCGCSQEVDTEKSNINSSVASKPIEHYTVYDNGVAIDNNTKLMWMRCSFGQAWDGSTCIGEAGIYKWSSAKKAINTMNEKGGFAGFSDWQMPNIDQLSSLRYCPEGFRDTIKIPMDGGGIKVVGQGCIGKYQTDLPTIHEAVFPKTSLGGYWTSSFEPDHDDRALNVFFIYAIIAYGLVEYNDGPVRAVRVVK